MKISELYEELYPSLTAEQAKGIEQICLDVTGKDSVGETTANKMRTAKRKIEMLDIKEVLI